MIRTFILVFTALHVVTSKATMSCLVGDTILPEGPTGELFWAGVIPRHEYPLAGWAVSEASVTWEGACPLMSGVGVAEAGVGRAEATPTPVPHFQMEKQAAH